MKSLSRHCALALGVLSAALAGAPAYAAPSSTGLAASSGKAGHHGKGDKASPPGNNTSPPVSTLGCSTPSLSQPFLSVHDRHWYELAPGQAPDDFTGNGWHLSGGARIATVRLADGHTGSVLDLPAGAQAVSPAFCVTAQFPAARTMIRTGRSHGALAFSMELDGTQGWTAAVSSGQRHGKHGVWTLSNRINLHPPHSAGWHLMRIRLVSRGRASESQVYNLFVDPRMRG